LVSSSKLNFSSFQLRDFASLGIRAFNVWAFVRYCISRKFENWETQFTHCRN